MIVFPFLALDAFDAGAVRFGAFRYKYHEEHPELPLEPSYLNFRIPPRRPLTDRIAHQLGVALYWTVSLAHREYRAIVGVPDAGDPLAATFAKIANVPQLWLGKEEHDGERRIVPGLLAEHMVRVGIKSGDRVLLIDDLITRAHSKLEAVQALRPESLVVEDVAVLIDREQGGREALEQAGLRLHSVWGFTELMYFYMRERRLTHRKYVEVVTHLQAQRRALGLL